GVVLEQCDPDHDHEHRDEPDVQDLEQDDREDDVQQAEHAAGDEHPQRETRVASVSLAFHRRFSPSLKPRRLIPILAAGLFLAAGSASAADVAVLVVPPFEPATYAARRAAGLF